MVRYKHIVRVVVWFLLCSLPAVANEPPSLTKPIPDFVVPAEAPFQLNLQATGDVVFGYGAGGEHLKVTDNYFSSNVRFFQDWRDVSFSGNTIIRGSNGPVVQFDKHPFQDPASDFIWWNNTYFTNSVKPFQLGKSKQSFEAWQANNAFSSDGPLLSHPTLNHVAVRPNRYETGRGHVVVYNWERLDRVDVDLSNVVDVGSSFRVFNVLNLSGQPVVDGVYTGRFISIPMTDVVAMPPLGHQPAAPLTVDKEFAAFLIVSKAASGPATGTQFFVTPEGQPNGTGSQKYPWDLQTAFTQTSPIRPGDTIWLAGGTYNGCLTSKLTGTASKPIHVRVLPGQHAKLDLFQGRPDQPKRWTIEGAYTTYQGMEVFSSDPSPRTTKQAGSWPTDINRGELKVVGDHIKLVNLQIHDLDNGISYWSEGDGGEVYGSLIYNNGWIGPDRNHGHAIYTQNAQSLRSFTDNIAFNQFRNGIKIYGSQRSSLKNYHLEGNVSFNNGGGTGAGFAGTFQLLIGGDSPAENITLHQNYTYVGKSYFRDLDPGDRLNYSARLSDGSPLPAWLTLTVEGRLHGSPPHAATSPIEIEVTATDLSGASTTDVFGITVTEIPFNSTPKRLSSKDRQTR
jgi:Putative Ig domain